LLVRNKHAPTNTDNHSDMPKMPAPPSTASTSGGAGNWAISNEAKNNYLKLWDTLEKNPQGLVEGKVAAAFFAKSGHSREILRSIWQLSDVGADGKLDKVEFLIGMHLTMMAKKGNALPSSVPSELMQSAKQGGGGTVMDLMNSPTSSTTMASSLVTRTSASGGGSSLTAQLNEASNQLMQETDRLRDMDNDLVRIRAEVAEYVAG
jgi:hypothetical protein